MALAKKKRKYWTCRKCSFRNERTASRKCQGCEEQTKPKKHVPPHQKALRDVTYEEYVELNGLIHGLGEVCALCLTEPKSRRLDRDHGHHRDEVTFGKPRGLLHADCNQLLDRRVTLEFARNIVRYLEAAESFYAEDVAA